MQREFSASIDFPVFANSYKKTDKQPDRRAKVEMSKALLQEMVRVAKRGEQPILEIAVWNNTSKDGKTKYLYCKMQMNEYEMAKVKQAEAVPEAEAFSASDDTFGEKETVPTKDIFDDF